MHYTPWRESVVHMHDFGYSQENILLNNIQHTTSLLRVPDTDVSMQLFSKYKSF